VEEEGVERGDRLGEGSGGLWQRRRTAAEGAIICKSFFFRLTSCFLRLPHTVLRCVQRKVATPCRWARRMSLPGCAFSLVSQIHVFSKKKTCLPSYVSTAVSQRRRHTTLVHPDPALAKIPDCTVYLYSAPISSLTSLAMHRAFLTNIRSLLLSLTTTLSGALLPLHLRCFASD
jgi:hypothetical protein